MSESKGFEMIEIGITDKRDLFYTPRYHTLIAAATGVGKTEVARKIISEMRRQIPDLRILIFDVKSSIPGYSPVAVRYPDGSIDIVSIEWLWNKIDSPMHPTEKSIANGEEIKQVKGLHVLSVQPNSHKHMAHWIPLKTVLCHRYEGELVRLNTLDGLIDTSPNHSVIRISKDHNREEVADARDIVSGDWLSEPYLPRVLRSSGDFFGTDDLAWLYGFFLAEGWISHNVRAGHNKFCLVISNNNKALLERAKTILENIFHHPVSFDTRPKSEFSKDQPFAISVTSKFIYEHFEKLFYLEKPYNSSTKKVPKEILNAPQNIQESFLEGFWDGDGTRSGDDFSRFATTSQLIAMGIIWLMKSLYGRSWSLHIRDDKPDSIDVVFNKNSRNRDKRNVVKKTRRLPFSGNLFDLETDSGDGTFCSGVGPIRIHNTGRDWEGYGTDVPIYVERATDSRFLRDLIETQEERKIDWFFYELHIACEGAKTWHDVLKNLQTRYEKYKDRNQIKEEKLGTLIIYMEALLSELDKGDTTERFDLSNPVTVLPLNFREEAFKQLAVYSYLTAMKKNRVRRILVVCDEMSSLAPSKEGTGCRKIIESYLFKQGRAAEVFGLAIDQEITGISPSVRRQCWNWILGMQTDTGAQKRTIDEIPGHNLTIDDIATLGVGWWYGVIRTPSKTIIEKFYLVPEGIDLETGKKVAIGDLPVEEVMKRVLDLRKKEQSRLIPKVREEVEAPKEYFEKLEKRLDEIEEHCKSCMQDCFFMHKVTSEMTKHIEENANVLATLKNQVLDLKDDYGFLEKKIADIVRDLDETGQKLAMIPSASQVPMEITQVEVPVKILHEESEPEKVSTTTVFGKILFTANKDFKDAEFSESEISEKMKEFGWNISHNTLAPSLGNLVKDGKLIKSGLRPIKYRLPSRVKFEI